MKFCQLLVRHLLGRANCIYLMYSFEKFLL
jgi:hypothetical protein